MNYKRKRSILLVSFFVGVLGLVLEGFAFAAFDQSSLTYLFVNFAERSSYEIWIHALIIAQPVIGGVVIVVLLLGTEKDRLKCLEVRDVLKKELKSNDQKAFDVYFESVPIAVVEWDVDFRIKKWNGVAEKIFGYSEKEVIGEYAYGIVSEKHIDELKALWSDVMLHKKSVSITSQNITKENHLIFCEWNIVPMLDEAGEITSVYSIAQDVTRRTEIEIALCENESKLKSILNAIKDFVCVVEMDGTISYANPAAYNEMNVPKEKWGFIHLNEIMSEDDVIIALDRMQQSRVNGATLPVRVYNIKKYGVNNEVIPVEIRTTSFYERGSKKVLVVARPIYERLQLDAERLKLDKLDSIGIFAGGIAHDFNNLLASIMGNASLLSAQLPQFDKKIQLSDSIVGAANRAVSLTQQLLTFAKGGVSVQKIISIAQVIEDSAEFVLGKSSPSKCTLKISEDLWFINADFGQLCQVVQNLIINANQSMPEGGIIWIGAENMHMPCDNQFGLNHGDYVHVWVEDSGIGIPQKYIDKIFDPYFSTKKTIGSGSGLGLAIAYSVLQKHNGHIAVDSVIGEGTTFHMYIPAVPSDASVNCAHDVKKENEMKNLNILLMDDDEMIQSVVEKMIQFLGHRVTLTSNGDDALVAYEAAFGSGDPFDLVILDLTIPGGMGGIETSSKLRVIDPHVVTIASSGYSDENHPDDFNGFLPKPFTLDAIKTVLREVIA